MTTVDPAPYFIAIVCIGFSFGYLAGRIHGSNRYPRRRRRTSAPTVLFDLPRNTKHHTP